MSSPEAVLSFWLDEVGPGGWYNPTAALDAQIRDRFQLTWERAAEGTLAMWLTQPAAALAYCILMDQFPRNMFRGEARAFATDAPGLAAAKMAISRDWDTRIDEPARQFFYLPLMHAENLVEQDRCVRLILTRMPRTGAENLLHARAHREVIRRFGRFPHRNRVLGRESTEAEAAFLQEGGYGAVVREMKAAPAEG